MTTYLILIAFAAGGIGGGLMLGQFVRRVSGQRAFVNLFAVAGLVAGLLFGMDVDDTRKAEARANEARQQTALQDRSPYNLGEKQLAEIKGGSLDGDTERGAAPEADKLRQTAELDPSIILQSEKIRILPEHRESARREMSRARTDRYLRLLLKTDPYAEEQLQRAFRKHFATRSDPSAKVLAIPYITWRVTRKFFRVHAKYAPDAVVFRYLEHNLDMLGALETEPAACAAYFGTWPYTVEPEVETPLKGRDTERKIALLESHRDGLAAPAQSADIFRVKSLLSDAYVANGFDRAGLSIVSEPGAHEPADVCRAARTFLQAVVALGEKDAAYVFKSLVDLKFESTEGKQAEKVNLEPEPETPPEVRRENRLWAFMDRKPAGARREAEVELASAKRSRFYKAFYRAYPEAGQDLLFSQEKAFGEARGGSDRERLQAHKWSVFKKHFGPRFLDAADAVVFRFMEHNLDVLRALKTEPAACAAYFRSWPHTLEPPVSAALMGREYDLKADVLKSAAEAPSPPEEPADPERVFTLVTASYLVGGHDIESMRVLENAAAHDDAAVCRAATAYMRAVVALGEKDAAHVFKSQLDKKAVPLAGMTPEALLAGKAGEDGGENRQGQNRETSGRDYPAEAEGALEAADQARRRFYRTLFRPFPEAEAKLRREIGVGFRQAPSVPLLDRNAFTRWFATRHYFGPALFAAPDDVTYKYLEHSLDVLTELQGQPARCGSHYRGWPLREEPAEGSALKAREYRMRTELLERARAEPTPLDGPADPDKVRELVVDALVENDLDYNSLSTITSSAPQDQAEVCRGGMTYLRALLAMKPEDAAYVFKSQDFIAEDMRAGPEPLGQASQGAGEAADSAERVNEAIAETRRHHLYYQMLFEASAEAEAEFREEVGKIIEDHPAGDAGPAARRATLPAMRSHYDRHALRGSDVATHLLLKYSFQVLKALEEHPEACVGYYLGSGIDLDGMVDEAMIDMEMELRAGVLESALTNPSPPPDLLDPAGAFDRLSAGYEAVNLTDEEFYDIKAVNTHGRFDARACRAVTREVQAMLTLNAGDAAYVFKTLQMMK